MNQTSQDTVMQDIPLEHIWFGERFREDFGDLEDMIESIRDKGIIQPISVRRYQGNGSHTYELLAGGRRTTAAKAAGLLSIPAVIREPSEEGSEEIDLREIELFENVFRKEMEWHEKIKLVQRVQNLWEEKNSATPWKWSQRKTAKMLGISATHLGRQLDLAQALEIMPDLKDAKDETEARKKVNQLREKIAVNKLIKNQQEEIKRGGLKLTERAEANYMIGDAFAGLRDKIGNKANSGISKHVRLIEVDPPYAIDLVTTKKRKDDDDPDLIEYNEVERKDYNRFLIDICQLCYDLADDDAWLIFWFGSSWFTDVKIAIARAGWKLDPIPAIWDKGFGQTAAPNIYLARTYEPFFIARKGSPVLRNKGRANVFKHAPVPSGLKYHPTQRPLSLMEDIIQTFGTPSDTLVSPFLGSGTTLRAAYRSNMPAYGWDLSKEYKKRFLIQVQEDEEAND